MERTGVCVSVARFTEIERDATAFADARLETLTKWAGRKLNWGSYQQLQGFIHGDLGLTYSPYYKKGEVPDGKVSTDDRAIEWLSAHFKEYRTHFQVLREYRKALRMRGYAKKWAGMAVDSGEGYATLHPSFGLASDNDTRPGAKTGRFAIKNPALNQVPSHPEVGSFDEGFSIRTAFVAPPGHVVVACDASQLEVILIAHKAATLFGTSILTDKLKPQAGRPPADLHIQTAREVYGRLLGDRACLETPDGEYKTNQHTKYRRQTAKNLRYGLHYLKGGRGFGSSLFDENGDAIGDAEGCKLVDLMYVAEPELLMLKEWGRYWVKRQGYTSSLFGRWRMLDGWDSNRVGEFNRACRQEANWMAQAGGQEILALALIGISRDPRLCSLGYVLRLPVHDEIVGTCPEANGEECVTLVKEHITMVVELLAPLGASGGAQPNWALIK
jgi:DNA polymerase-1